MKPVNILVFARDLGVWLKVSRRLCKARRDRVFMLQLNMKPV